MHLGSTLHKRRKSAGRYLLYQNQQIKLRLSHKALKTLYTGDLAAPLIGRTGLGGNNRKNKSQEKVNQSTKADKHKDSESLQNSIKRRIVHNHRSNTHSHQNKRNGRTLQNC